MKRNHKIRRFLAGAFCVLMGLFCVLVPAMAFEHDAKPGSGVPTELIAEYTFDTAKAAAGETVWVLESIQVYKEYFVNVDFDDHSILDEYTAWDILNCSFNEYGGSYAYTHEWREGTYHVTIKAPGPRIASPQDFVFVTINPEITALGEDYMYYEGAICVTSEIISTEVFSFEDYYNSFLMGTEATVDGMPARVHNYAEFLPEPRVGSSFTISAFSSYFAVDFNYVVPDPGEGIVQTETSTALDTPGEDAGTEIISQIIETPRPHTPGSNHESSSGSFGESAALGIGGAIAAAGALGAALGSSGSSGKKGSEEEKKTRYKMYVYKAFGDAIQEDAEPVKVYARIARIIDGKEYDSPELTAKIQASGEKLTVRSAGVEGGYMAAEVSASSGSEAKEGKVIFTMAGPGGVFYRELIFRIVSEPKIVFPTDMGDGRWNLSEDNSLVKMVAGMGGHEKLCFVIVDAMDEPEEIWFSSGDGLNIRYERDPKLAFTYYALIDNETDCMEKGGGIFADKESVDITVEAIFKDHKKAQNYFTVELYPDGISVPPEKDHVKDNHLVVSTVEDSHARKAGYASIPPVIFDMFICYVDETKGTAVILKNPSGIEREELDDNGRYGLMFTENFEYHIKKQDGYWFFPELTLPMMKDPYYASISFSYDTDRERFESDLPIAFLGDAPKKPSSLSWNEAYEKLKRSVQYYGIGSDPEILAVVRNAEQHTAIELEYTRRWVILAGVKFYREESKAYKNFDALCGRYILVSSALVKAGDMAIEVILQKTMGGTAGKLTARFVNPMKNMLANFIGQYIGPGSELDGNYEDLAFFKSLAEGCEEALSEAITGMKLDADTLGYVICAYMMTCFAKHYYYGEKGVKGDVYRSMCAAVGDLALARFKAWFAGKIANMSKAVFEKIGKLGGDVFRGTLMNNARKAIEASGDKAYEEYVRAGIQAEGHLSTAAYEAARTARGLSKQYEEELQMKILESVGKRTGEYTAQAADYAAAFLINWITGGKKDDNEVLGMKTEDVLVEYICDRWGLKNVNVGKLAQASVPVSWVENGRLEVVFMGYEISVPLRENLEVFADMAVDTCFWWMQEVWRYAFPSPFGYPDPRDSINETVDMVERQKERLENLQPVTYEYYQS